MRSDGFDSGTFAWSLCFLCTLSTPDSSCASCSLYWFCLSYQWCKSQSGTRRHTSKSLNNFALLSASILLGTSTAIWGSFHTEYFSWINSIGVKWKLLQIWFGLVGFHTARLYQIPFCKQCHSAETTTCLSDEKGSWNPLPTECVHLKHKLWSSATFLQPWVFICYFVVDKMYPSVTSIRLIV